MVVDSKKRTVLSDEVELLFCKSKSFLHPTSSKKDNVAGYISLSRPANSTKRDILVSFTCEGQISGEDKKVYDAVDLAVMEEEEDGGDGGVADKRSRHQMKSKRSYGIHIVKKPPVSSSIMYCFSVPISYVYSIQFRTPTAGWWYGSVIIHTQDGEKMPIVFFHDNESPSTIGKQKLKNKLFDPFGDKGELYWGGQDFLNALSEVADVQKSSLQPSIYLINPESNDLRNFAPTKQPKGPEESQAELFKLPDVNKIIANAKWRVLETVATFTSRTRNQVIDVVEEHTPAPLRFLVDKPEVKRISEEFDSARVYLAKWASQVKEEAEQALKNYLLNDETYSKIDRELGLSSKKKDILTDEEVNKASRRKPISQVEWESFFDNSGRLVLTLDEVKYRIFHGGLDNSIRSSAWLFLLGIYPWDSSEDERKALLENYQSSYEDYKARWVCDEEKRSTEFWKDQKHRIEKDINRTDRNLPIFLSKKAPHSQTSEEANSLAENLNLEEAETPEEDEIEHEDENEDDPYDVSNITNPHLFRMREILLTYNEYNPNLGYVQGMTDLLSPVYVTLEDETLAFWAFTKFMDRMERNFLRDQSGMKKQMLTLNELVQFMLPDLFKHLESCEATDLFFFFRLLLVWFKREFEWEDVLSLWEILWTDYYSSQFHLFFALAILSANERIIKQNLTRFDEVLKYMNDLAMTMNPNLLLIRSELLFLRFRRMIDIIDRENSLRGQNNPDLYHSPDNLLIKISPDLRTLLSRNLVVQKEVERPEGVGGG